MPQYYISSTKFNIQERQTKKHGRVYDVVFRVVAPDGTEKQKKLSGYATKALAKEAYTDFVTSNCELLKNNPLKKIKPEKAEPTVSELIAQYMLTLGGNYHAIAEPLWRAVANAKKYISIIGGFLLPLPFLPIPTNFTR